MDKVQKKLVQGAFKLWESAQADESIEGMYRALDRIRDCGLNDSEQRMFKEHLWEIIALLYRTYTIVDFTED